MKENEFVIGKWYKFTSYGNCKNNYAKCIENGDIFKGSPWIYAGYLHDLGGWNYSSMSDIEEADMSEVSKFLPVGHPDKIIVDNKYNLQVGDVITIINNWEVKEVNKEGIKLGDSTINNSWEKVNTGLDKEGWKIKSRVKDMNKVEAPKTFLVKGDSKHLLKACLDEILELGYKVVEERELKSYFCSNIDTVTNNTTIKEYKNIFINSDLLTNPKADITFILPQDYSKAIEHAKSALNSEYWNKSKVKKMKFGELTVEVTPGLGYVQIAEGKVTKEDLKKVVDYIRNRPKILGYKVEFPDVPTTAHKLKFGYKIGKISELIAIYEAM